MATRTFKEAYGVLQQHAQTLRTQQEPNIDDLLSIVTESVDAYKVCKERIDAVEKALEKALGDTGATPNDTIRSPKSPSAPDRVAPDLDSDDVPF
jgi:exodeoxyribonuclease VII small subunit